MLSPTLQLLCTQTNTSLLPITHSSDNPNDNKLSTINSPITRIPLLNGYYSSVISLSFRPQLVKSWIALSTGKTTIQWISIRETNCAIHWIENYRVNSATCIQLLNNCGQIGIMHAWYMCNQQSLMNGMHRKHLITHILTFCHIKLMQGRVFL